LRWARWSLLALAAAVLLVGIGTATTRSTIPRAIDGVVTAKAAEPDGPLPAETAYFVSVDGRRMQVDRAVHDAVLVGDRVTKRRWSATLQTPRGGVALRLSRDTRGLAPLAVLLLGLAAVLIHSPRAASVAPAV
jgi:hypothetical protein